MPKDNIRDAITDGMRVEVGWGGIPGDDSGFVQVGTTNAASPFRFPAEYDEKGTPTTPNAGEPFDGWHVHLDRAGINRMIRALRKARDYAFGADA